jgi:oligopeptidase B
MRYPGLVSRLLLASAVPLLATALVGQTSKPAPPVARQVPKVDTLHGKIRVDPYFWLRDDQRVAPEVIGYLQAENRYSDDVMRPTEPLQKKLYQEMVGRIKETDQSVPEYVGGAWYYTRTVKGKQYPIFCRRVGSLKAREQVLLDENEVAGKRPYSRVGLREMSPDGNMLAYTLLLKDLRTGQVLPDRMDSVNYEVEWDADNRTLFYGRDDAAHRPYRIHRHELGSSYTTTSAAEPV